MLFAPPFAAATADSTESTQISRFIGFYFPIVEQIYSKLKNLSILVHCGCASSVSTWNGSRWKE